MAAHTSSHLSLFYISKEKKCDKLTIAEFARGYATILLRPDLSPVELSARIKHFSSLIVLPHHSPGTQFMNFMLQCCLRLSMARLAEETRLHICKTESYNPQAGSRWQGPLIQIALWQFSSAEIYSTGFWSS